MTREPGPAEDRMVPESHERPPGAETVGLPWVWSHGILPAGRSRARRLTKDATSALSQAPVTLDLPLLRVPLS